MKRSTYHVSEYEPRIRIIGGPWPERIGARGFIRYPTTSEAKVYPFHGLGRDEVVVLLDDDPIDRGRSNAAQADWSCVMPVSAVEVVT